MTRSQYVALSSALHRARGVALPHGAGPEQAAALAHRYCVEQIAAALLEQDSGFSVERFLGDAGLTPGRVTLRVPRSHD